MPRLRLDVLVLVIGVLAVLTFAPGHGAWGWVIGLVAALLGGVVMGLLGPRSPWIHGHPRGVRRD